MKTALASLFLAATSAAAQLPQHHDVSSLTPYTSHQKVSGVIRVYGNNYIPTLMKQWEEGFQNFQPNVTFTTNLPGTEAAMAGITTGIADISFIGREGYRSEINGFKGRWGYLPLGIEISSGSFGTPHKTFSLEVFVNKDNPLPGLTMEQAQEVFGNNPTIKTWGDLGVTGPMATHTIHVYGYQFDTGMAGYFNRVVLHDKGTWNPSLKDFDNGHDAKGEVINAGNYILKALADDPDGIAFANLQYTNDKIRALGLADDHDRHHHGHADRAHHDRGDEHEHFVEATPETIWDRTYPIHRFTTLYINRKPGTAVDPKVREFVAYILSREGMQAVADDGAYTPINESVAVAQRKKIE
ncbi:PstS family phosphate ABC transporter substrate-binding protein [Granulicella tundricola]|uniref:PBP domain-containing protein n=1 Tax=Granulicella tundricola (strain ATCC BAA-1859 / DSM 23138 / MP5ACTX9) TaxID=1198114 RepID=E8WY40_GRATM|nr:substrate-binding domain-containing protein [Granulicella tundricola]ADW67579.1 hypothetical protein AciX9_0507 [Granulicella tundricola MP5ACTX9]